jgi:hypothetical protein
MELHLIAIMYSAINCYTSGGKSTRSCDVLALRRESLSFLSINKHKNREFDFDDASSVVDDGGDGGDYVE